MQANHPSVQGKRLFAAIISIAKKEGIRGLWSVRKIFCKKFFFMILFFFLKNVLPTAQRAAIVSGVELAVYDWMKKQLICRFNSSDTIGTHFVSSFIAGFAGALASTPIDVVRVSYHVLFILLIFFGFCKDSFNESREFTSSFYFNVSIDTLQRYYRLFC